MFDIYGLFLIEPLLFVLCGLCLIVTGMLLVNKQSPKNTNDSVANPSALTDAEYAPSGLVYKGPKGSDAHVDQVHYKPHVTHLSL